MNGFQRHAHHRYDRHRHDHDKGIRRKFRWLVRFPKLWQSPINRAVIKLVAPVPGERALDVGAGMGPATVLAARLGASVVAVDPSRFMRAILGFRRQIQRNPSRITIEAGAAEDLPLAGGSTEVAFTVNAIHHWTDLEVAVTELARVLAPRGRAVLVDEDDEFRSPNCATSASSASNWMSIGRPASSVDRTCRLPRWSAAPSMSAAESTMSSIAFVMSTES